MKRLPWTDIIGWSGAVTILSAYALVTLSMLSPGSLLTVFLNVYGSIGLMYLTWRRRAYPNFVVNVIWLLIAVVSFFKGLS